MRCGKKIRTCVPYPIAFESPSNSRYNYTITANTYVKYRDGQTIILLGGLKCFVLMFEETKQMKNDELKLK